MVCRTGNPGVKTKEAGLGSGLGTKGCVRVHKANTSLGKAGARLCSGAGASAMAGMRRASPVTGVPVPGVAYVPLDLLQKNGKAGWMLTVARTRAV